MKLFADRQEEKGIDAFFKVIKDGNPNNRYTIARLLIRAID
jgi:hypothetical protein